MAGQMIMQGFVGFRIPIIVRRLVTMIPAFVVVWLGVNSTNALVMSQVVLSIALPAPVIALLMFTRRKDIMGAFVNSRLTNIAAVVGAVLILTLNVVLLLQTFRRGHSRSAEQLIPVLGSRQTSRKASAAPQISSSISSAASCPSGSGSVPLGP